MIEVSITTALVLYLFVTLSILFLLWLGSHWQKSRKISLAEQAIVSCEYCHHLYLGRIEKAITQCPRCRSFNQKNFIFSKGRKN